MKLLLTHRQKDPALADLGDMGGVGIQMAAGKRVGMNDQAVEDAAVRHNVLDNADAAPVTVVNRSAVFHAKIGDRIAELVERAMGPCSSRSAGDPHVSGLECAGRFDGL